MVNTANKNAAAVTKIMAELSKDKPQPLTDDQERLWKQAVDPEERHLQNIEHIFVDK